MVKVIAEAGVNHNGSLDLAFRLIDVAHAAGVDIVKFQTFKAKNLVTEDAKSAEYQTRNIGVTESQYTMLSRLELDYESHNKLVKYCNKIGIEYLSTAFDSESLNFLVNEQQLKTLKIPSGELTNAPFILEHARTGCDLIISTGMASLAEVESALGVVAFGFISGTDNVACEASFAAAYASKEGRAALKERVTLLHCTTEYPAQMGEINLRAMQTMRAAFGLEVGYSDHSAGISIPVAATAMGAQLIEKHFTLDKSMDGPDHKASLEPDELAAMVRGIRDVELALGDGIKGPQPSEEKNKKVARKSLVASMPIKKGEVLTKTNIDVKRPGDGLSPFRYWSVLDCVASRDYKKGDLIRE